MNSLQWAGVAILALVSLVVLADLARWATVRIAEAQVGT